jgi:ABC-type branched-subunit amino acid transport system permease subunit
MAGGARRFLLPHERWLAGWLLDSQRRRKTAPVVRTELKYGPTGMMWLDASLANLPFGMIFALAAFIPIMVSATKTSRLGLYLIAIACLFLVLSGIRLLQASRAGRKFRATHQ